jgi:CRP-like cAMP-binding protein
MERWPGLTEEDEIVRTHFFSRLNALQFKQLLELGERRTLRDGDRLTTEREACGYLYFVERGHVTLDVAGERVALITRGGFVNDVAFQQGPQSPACAPPQHSKFVCPTLLPAPCAI